MPPDDKSGIDELQKSLYSRDAPEVRTRRKLRFQDEVPTVQRSWQGTHEEEEKSLGLNESYEDNSMSFFTKLLIGSVIFCLIAVGVGAYLFFNGKNLISADNIDVTIDGPVSVPGGEPVSFDIGIINKNNVDLQLVDMTVNFPAGTTNPSNPSQELKKYQNMFGDLSSGGVAHQSVQAIMFGEENTQKEVVVSLTYGIKGSNSVFTKSKSYEVLINSSPISVSVSSFKEVTSGQEFDLKVNIRSNSGQTLKNVLLHVNYPFGFTAMSSTPQSVSGDDSLWRIGDIPAAGQRNVTIHGKLSGENSDTKSFRFSVGAQDSSNINLIGTEYMSVQQDVAIQKPFISLTISVDSDNTTKDFIGEFGRSHQVVVTWFNNLTVPVTNAVITIHLSGNAYDKKSVSPGNGLFRSVTDDIILSQQTNPALASLGAGESGSATFSIIPKDLSTGSNLAVNPTINISANVSGDRSQESQVPESLTVVASRKILVSSTMTLSGRIVRSTGPFKNTGPVPPQVDQETTYTVLWTVNNTSNSVNNTKVTAVLPPYIKWLGNVSPSNEDVSYDKNSGTVSWNIGSLNASSGSNSSSRRREVDFQISLLPGANLVGQTPVLVNQSTLTASDGFTGAQLQSNQDSLLSSFSTDPTFKSTDGIVVQ